MKNKKERLKKIVREELGNTVNEKFDFSNIANVELAMPGDPDLLDLGPIPRSYKVYKVTLGNQGLYFYLKHFSDPMKSKLKPLGGAPKIPDMLVGMASKAIEKAIESLVADAPLTLKDKKPAHAGAYIDRPDGQRVYAKGMNEMKITKQRLKEIIKEELTKSLKESKETHVSNIAKKIDRLEQAVLNAKKGMQNMEQGATDDADLQDVRSTNAYFSKQQEVMNLEDKIELLTKQLKQLKQDEPGQLERGVSEELTKVDKEKKKELEKELGDLKHK